MKCETVRRAGCSGLHPARLTLLHDERASHPRLEVPGEGADVRVVTGRCRGLEHHLDRFSAPFEAGFAVPDAGFCAEVVAGFCAVEVWALTGVRASGAKAMRNEASHCLYI